MKHRLNWPQIRFVALFLLALALPPRSYAALHVAAASSFAPALESLRAELAERGLTLRISSAASGILYQQILRGAPYDLFFSADELLPRKLQRQGLSASLNHYANGRLVMASRKPALLPTDNSPERWRSALTASVAQPLSLANPRHAPYGRAAMEVLQFLNLAELDKVIGNNVSHSALHVHTGQAPQGFVSASLVKNRAEFSIMAVPIEWYTPIRQYVAVLASSERRDESRALIAFLHSDTGLKRLAELGFGPPL